MKRVDIKKMMVVYDDVDFIRVWDWIGKTTLMTINGDTNVCGGKILEESDDIENFIKSLVPTGIEFLQYRQNKYSTFCRYRDIFTGDEMNKLAEYLQNVDFYYNDEITSDVDGSGSGTLIIDIENNTSFIH